MTEKPKMAVINWFEHVRKGAVPRVFTRRGGATPVPGDGIFCEVNVDGCVFACTILGSTDDVKPEQFELAIRSVLAGLHEHTGTPHPQGVYVVPEGEAH